MKPANYWIEKYAMQPHPEGGFFAETYRASETIPQAALPNRFLGERNFDETKKYLRRRELESTNFPFNTSVYKRYKCSNTQFTPAFANAMLHDVFIFLSHKCLVLRS